LQYLDDFYYLDIWQCARYFVAALFMELVLITNREMWGLESRSRTRLEIWARSRSRRLRSRLHHWTVCTCSVGSWFIKLFVPPA